MPKLLYLFQNVPLPTQSNLFSHLKKLVMFLISVSSVRKKTTKNTLFHCLWQCDEVKKFWEAVRMCLQDFLPIQIPLDAKLVLLGLYPEKYNIRKGHRIFLEIGILLAKRIIALSWKNWAC